MKTAVIFTFIALAQLGSSDVLSTKLVSTHMYPNLSPSWTNPVVLAETTPTATSGYLSLSGTTPYNFGSGGFNASMYQTATFQFGFTTSGTNPSPPPQNVYLHYAGNLVSLAQEPSPTPGWASFGSQTSGSSSTFPLSSINSWNATARFGVLHQAQNNATGTPPPEIQIASSSFGGWQLVSSGSQTKTYVSVGTYTITSPTVAVGGIMSSNESFNAWTDWGYALLFSLS